MASIPDSVRGLLATGLLATVVTLDPDGTRTSRSPGPVSTMRDASDGVVVHVTVDRIYGQGPWREEEKAA